MKISPINRTPISYKGYEKEEVLAYDDPSLKAAREKMRENILADVIAEENMDRVLEEWHFNKMIDNLIALNRNSDSYFKPLPKKSSNITTILFEDPKFQKAYERHRIMEKMPTFGVDFLDGVENSYRGSMPERRYAKEASEILKEAGVKTVVDLVGVGIGDIIEEEGLEYVYIPSELLTSDADMYKTTEDAKNTAMSYLKYVGLDEDTLREEIRCAIDNHQENMLKEKEILIKYIQTMQKDNLYVGCDYGKYRTDRALILNTFLNPKAGERYCNIHANEVLVFFLLNLYENLTPEDKARMGWTKEFDENFVPKIEKALME